ncbi:hypothetical protein [Streptomyces sp. NRRL S-455]|uniref:hypothetical protein n=1 Tax=Streptomyces sp. NRRL S-455 TaxID=1463908 RepID=UPI0004BF37BC|nr:hypothetical protein [Streptomyces sp. NRRL S-455]
MTKELNCTGCGGQAVHTKTVPLCSRCALAVAEESLGFVFDGLRSDAGVIQLPAAPEDRMSPAEADDVAYQRLSALRRQGAKRVTFEDFKDLQEITGRSRPWVYRWLDARVKDGDLVKDTAGERVGYVYAPD